MYQKHIGRLLVSEEVSYLSRCNTHRCLITSRKCWSAVFCFFSRTVLTEKDKLPNVNWCNMTFRTVQTDESNQSPANLKCRTAVRWNSRGTFFSFVQYWVVLIIHPKSIQMNTGNPQGMSGEFSCTFYSHVKIQPRFNERSHWLQTPSHQAPSAHLLRSAFVSCCLKSSMSMQQPVRRKNNFPSSSGIQQKELSSAL